MKKGVPILLVEDDDVDAENVLRAFKKNNISNPLHVSINGEDALDWLRRSGKFAKRHHPRPGIILLDLNMPVMSGIEFLEIIKADEALKRIPVVILTSSWEESDREKCFALNVAGYIIKPVEFEKFVDAVNIIDRYWSLSELR